LIERRVVGTFAFETGQAEELTKKKIQAPVPVVVQESAPGAHRFCQVVLSCFSVGVLEPEPRASGRDVTNRTGEARFALRSPPPPVSPPARSEQPIINRQWAIRSRQ